MLLSPLTRVVEVEDAKFTLNVPFGAKLEFLKCVKVDGDGNTDYEIDRLVDVLLKNNCLKGWEGVFVENEAGDEVPLEFRRENIGRLGLDVLVQLAIQAMEIAYGGNETGSESK